MRHRTHKFSIVVCPSPNHGIQEGSIPTLRLEVIRSTFSSLSFSAIRFLELILIHNQSQDKVPVIS